MSHQVCDRTTDCTDGTDETTFECLYTRDALKYNILVSSPHIGCDRVIFRRSICGHFSSCLDGSDQNCIPESKFFSVSVTVNTLHMHAA